VSTLNSGPLDAGLDSLIPVFREAIPSDAARVVDLIESAYRGRRSREGWTTEADLLDGQRTDVESVLTAINREGVWLLLAVAQTPDAEGELVGCCQLERRSSHTAYFGSFAVRPGLQSNGLGRRLLAAAESHAREVWGASVVEMTVIGQRDELLAWYERRGYARTGEIRPFPYEDERAGLPRRPDLHFVVMAKSLGK
jgi:ribosomal protein S18 acetylase RimI-like enzyme